MSTRRPAWGWAVVTAATGTVLIGIGAFWLSFMALADLAARSGIASGQAWIWPLLVDGLIVVSTIAVVALDGGRGAWYPWALLIRLEEHTSELQSRGHLVCRLLLENKKRMNNL